jgi:hypothetical protein
MEQRTAIKFCFILRKSASETYELLQKAYGSDSLSRSTIFEWFKQFREGRDSLEDDVRSGRLLPEETSKQPRKCASSSCKLMSNSI